MPVKLNSSGGGSVTLDVPATTTAVTLNLPVLNGTLVTGDGSGNVSISGNLSFNSGYGSAAVGYGCRAWVNFNGEGTVSIRSSGNVSSITDNGTGDYTVNFTTAMSDANFAFAGTCLLSGAVGTRGFVTNRDAGYSAAAGSVRIGTLAVGVGLQDFAFVNIAVFR